MTALNVIDLNIDEKAYGYAKIYSSLLSDEFQRKRSYAEITALYALVGELEKTGVSVQKSMTLFRQPKLNEEYELTDFYVNDWFIDVRVVVDANAVLVPKVHYDNDLAPDFYAVVKVDNKISKAQLLGFVDVKNTKTEPLDYHYNSIPLDSLISCQEFLKIAEQPKKIEFEKSEHEHFRELFLSLLDDEMDKYSKNRILKHLLNCPACRTEFCCFTGFEMVCCNVCAYEDLMQDKTLEIVGAVSVNNEENENLGELTVVDISDNGEETVESQTDSSEELLEPELQDNLESTDENTLEDIPAEDIVIEEQADLNEEQSVNDETSKIETASDSASDTTVSDILDELFSLEEDNYNPQELQDKPLELDPEYANEPENIELSNDIEELEENSQNDIQPIDDYSENTDDNDLTPIEDNEDLILDESDEDRNISMQDNNDLIIEDVASPEIKDTQNTADNRQKVIVDYDENGEPVYSYITNIQDNDSSEIDNIENLSDDDILNENFNIYPETNNEYVDLSTINNGAERPVEYVQSDDEYFEEYQVSNNNENGTEEISQTLYDTLTGVENYDDTQNTSDNDYVNQEVPEQKYEESTAEPVQEPKYEESTYSSADVDSEEESDVDEVYPEDEINSENDDNINDDDDDTQGEYEDYELEIPDANDTKKSSQKNGIIAAIAVLVLIGGGIGSALYLKNHSSSNNNLANNPPQEESMFEPIENIEQEMNTQQNNTEGNMPEQNQEESGENLPEVPTDSQEDNGEGNLTENDLVPPAEPERTINDELASAFSPDNGVSIRGVNWLCTPQLFTDREFKAYLQNLDEKVKLNLRNNILNATEQPSEPTIIVKLAVNNDGNLDRVAISQSSGSRQIDNIVLQSINETFVGGNSPVLNDSTLKSDKYYLKLIVKL